VAGVDGRGPAVGRVTRGSVKGDGDGHLRPTGAAVEGAVTTARGSARVLGRQKDGGGVGGVHVEFRRVVGRAPVHIGGDIGPGAAAVGGNKKAPRVGVTLLGREKTIKAAPDH